MAFDFGNFGARLFGGGLLSNGQPSVAPQLQSQAGNMALMNAAAALLRAKDTPNSSLSGALGNAILAGQQGYQGALTNDLQRQFLQTKGDYMGAQTNALKQKAAHDAAVLKTIQDVTSNVMGGAAPTAVPAVVSPDMGPVNGVQTFPAVDRPDVPGVDIGSGQTPPMYNPPTITSATPPATDPAKSMMNPAQRTITAPPNAPATLNAGKLRQIAAQLAQRGLTEQAQQYSKLADSLDGKQTGIMQNLVAAGYQPGTPEYRQAMRDYLRKGGTTVNVQTAGNAFDKEFGKQNADEFFKQRGAAQDAVSSLQNNQQARKLLDSGVITGFGAPFATGFGNALERVGIHLANNPVANTQAYTALRAQEVGRLIKMFGSGTGLSDADREYATKAAAGDVTMDEKAIRRLLDISDRANRAIIERYNRQAAAVDPRLSPYPLTVEMPSVSSPPQPAAPAAPAAPPAQSSGDIKFLGFE